MWGLCPLKILITFNRLLLNIEYNKYRVDIGACRYRLIDSLFLQGLQVM